MPGCARGPGPSVKLRQKGQKRSGSSPPGWMEACAAGKVPVSSLPRPSLCGPLANRVSMHTQTSSSPAPPHPPLQSRPNKKNLQDQA